MYNVEDQSVDTLQVKQRNFVSAMNTSEKSGPSTEVKSYCFTPDKKTLVTFEDLHDENSHKEFHI